ncbi:uncharacterized protein I303_104570 [Kwoniella dejecticola CBS 10117]|uniref:Major facilitator superfamily (MFS) profile domain-containing protein n=1 Tax=Kwoniella dejecticola CBS 10117 TaxID=1296121 RepID=A0A1A6A4Y7_9TREE|nr:uncharacterized protein I303_04453 [Kwoniella dejecticola CBS 10117]OBR85122.1 hypothetical protein I303_04453 [Kwoniella dejecticola CBS 10117]
MSTKIQPQPQGQGPRQLQAGPAKVQLASGSGSGSGQIAGTNPSTSTSQSPLERSGSRISNALSRIQSTEAYPPQDRDVSIPTKSIISGKPTITDHGEKGVSNDGGEPNSGKNKKALNIGLDIEHVPVEDDPRDWSEKKKWFALLVVTAGLLGPVMAASIYNPVINELAEELHASEAETGLSLSMYILFQGWTPVVWAIISEPVYLTSFAIYIVALIVASRANSMPLLIVMRALQAVGSGAVTALGAGSLADMYEMHERGTKMGIYYGLPMLGPGIAPLLGGALGQAFGWRSVFYFLTAYAGVMMIAFIFFPDSWRRERSRVYQKAISNATKRAEIHSAKKALRKERKLAKASDKLEDIPATPNETPLPSRRPSQEDGMNVNVNNSQNDVVAAKAKAVEIDVEKQPGFTHPGEVKIKTKTRRNWYGRKRIISQEEEPVKLSFRDLNPLPTMISVVRKPANSVLLTASGILFAAQYTTVYTASITLGDAPYNYNSLQIGLVLLAFGIGNILASILGGRYSDLVLRRLKKKNGGVMVAEMRLKATFVAMPFLVLGFVAYAWIAQEKVHIAGIVVSLVISGFALLWIYSSTLAYLVDANPGISSSAVSLNSLFRGVMACIMSQIAVPIRNGIGDGGLYTLFAGLLALSCAGLVLLAYKGERWRIEGQKSKESKMAK